MNLLYLNPDTWELEEENGVIKTLSGKDAIGQNLKQRLQTFVGEWFLDQTIYIDYFEKIFVKNPSNAIITSEIKRVIRNTPGIIEITIFNLTVDKTTRELSVVFTATTVDGVLEYNEILKATREAS